MNSIGGDEKKRVVFQGRDVKTKGKNRNNGKHPKRETSSGMLMAGLQPPATTRDPSIRSSTSLHAGDLPATPGPSVKRVTLNEVLQQHPAETRVETDVIRDAEDTDSTDVVSNKRPTILPHVPVGSERHFVMKDIQSSARALAENRSQRGVGSIRSAANANVATNNNTAGEAVPQSTIPPLAENRRVKTMEEQLDGLTDVLEAIHGTENDPTTPPVQDVPSERPISSSDTMNRHAHLLKKRPTAKQRWADLHNVFVATGGPMRESDRISAMTTSVHEISADLESGRLLNATSRRDDKPDDDDPSSPYSPAGWHQQNEPAQPNCCTQCLSKVPLAREFLSFLDANEKRVWAYFNVIMYIMLPAVVVAAALFYWDDNFPTGRVDRVASEASGKLINHLGKPIDPNKPSVSYLLLFLCCRQIVTFTLAQATQLFVIDFLCVGRRMLRSWPTASLLVVQSRGWPFLLACWSVCSLGMNSGAHAFSQHWLFWQTKIGLFSDENPSGGVPDSEILYRVFILSLSVGIIVAVKRTWIGFFLGRKTYDNYAEGLSKVMKKIILLSNIAQLGQDIEQDYMEAEYDDRMPHLSRAVTVGAAHSQIATLVSSASHNQEEEEQASVFDHDNFAVDPSSPFVIDTSKKNKLTGALTEGQQLYVSRLLGSWEEPEQSIRVEESVSIKAVLRFRQSLTYLDTPFTFSYAFGRVDSRENCIESAQEVFMRLFLDDPQTDSLNFDVIATLARRNDGSFNTDVLKDLIALVRPERDGTISLIDFVKSVDSVYKQARLLRTSIKNSHKIDVAFEFIFNFLIILSVLGLDPFALFLSLSSIILAFAFMIGSASSKYFEGLLFILVQKPYDIGDRINIEPANSPGKSSGSASWVVKDVNLFTTTLLLGGTNEKATVSNGSLASSRIINAARSPHAVIIDFVKFGLDVPYAKLKVYSEALTQFVKARPREWLSLVAFRACDVQVDQGFIKYILILQHRHSWQDIGAVKSSQADVQSYCLELAKEMELRYQQPPMPVNVSMTSGVDDANTVRALPELTANSLTLKRVAEMFDKGD